MLRVALSTLRVRRLRSLLVTVMLGVSILGGSIVYGDTARAAFFDDLARGAAGVDVWATAKDDPKLTGSDAVAAVAAIPGVAHVDQRPHARIGLVGRNGRVVTNAGEIGLAVPTPAWEGFAPYRVSAGRVPRGSGEMSLDQPTANREGIPVGGRVTVLDRAGKPHELTVVGLVDFGASDEYADKSVVVLMAAQLTSYATVDGDADIVVAGPPGASQDALSKRVEAALGPGYVVITGVQLRHQLAVNAGKYVDSFLTTLRVASLVALAVALLVVYNTFQILVAQRKREHALLRCVGASRRQVIQLVVAESALLGSVASLGSVLLSIAAGYAIVIGQNVFGRGLPEHSLVVSRWAILVPLATGVLATMASAVLPAIAAGRVSPLAAMRDSADAEPNAGGAAGGTTGGATVRRWLTVAAAAGVGAIGLVVTNHGRGKGFDGLPVMVGGAMIVFVAMILIMPLLITTVSAPLRWLFGGLFGATGRLAMGNARRHPVRFAATTTALIVGIAPMTAFTILLNTAQTQGVRELAENFPVDFVVSHAAQPATKQSGAPRGFSASLIEQLRARPELGVVAICRVAGSLADGRSVQIGTAESGVLGSRLAVEVREGDLSGLAPGTAAVTVDFAHEHGLSVGDTIRVGPQDHTWNARIVATYDNTPVPADLLVNWSDFAAADFSGTDFLLIRRAEASSAAAAAAALDATIADDPLAVVSSTADRRESLADSLGRRLIQFNVLLGASMLIAVLGIANALFLSVLERTRESAILRAVGLGRRQMYGMLLIEAVLIGLVGACAGVAFGVGLGWITAHELILAYGHGTPTIPLTAILVYVAIAILGGAVASILPGRRAAGASIVAAMETI